MENIPVETPPATPEWKGREASEERFYQPGHSVLHHLVPKSRQLARGKGGGSRWHATIERTRSDPGRLLI